MNLDVSKMPFLGQGGFGIVHKADEKTALKVLHVGQNNELRTLALLEIQFLMGLNR